MTFNFENFITSLHKQNADVLTLPELRKLLDLGDAYTKDTPISTGKRLTIDNISFFGEKSGNDTNLYPDSKIAYTQPVGTGVNIWIADNLKGKSSIFKILKFALTGRNKIKPNIKKWLHHILVNFSINEKSYSIYLNTEKSLKGSLYNGRISSVYDVASHNDDLIFAATSETSYESQIEEFFFRQFSYYSLKWTAKSPSKVKEELQEVGASWVTYFESIFLESRDSGSLTFGGQGKKVFQMLLGLEFTYPINKLTVEKERLQYEHAKQVSFTETQNSKRKKDEAKLKSRSAEIDSELLQLKENSRRIDIGPLSVEYDTLLSKVQQNNKRAFSLGNDLSSYQKKLGEIESERDYRSREESRIFKEVQKLNKQINDLQEFIEIGIFFSNLDIKHCPSCDHSITPQKKAQAASTHTCSVCNDPIVQSDETDIEDYGQKVDNLKMYRDALLPKLETLRNTNDAGIFEEAYNNVLTAKQGISGLPDATAWNQRLTEISSIIEHEQNRPKPEQAEIDSLIAEKAVIDYKLQQLEVDSDDEENNYEAKIHMLISAINELNQQRIAASGTVLKRLQTLMLEEIHQLGLTSITEILITEALDIRYRQDGDLIKFDDIAEGEQLRAKISFYLSLIQLDIEYNFGRHTRFLIIDSPAKEEADDKYMQGLASVLQTINNRFSNNLQILIGTAERSLTNVVGNEYITPSNEFVF